MKTIFYYIFFTYLTPNISFLCNNLCNRKDILRYKMTPDDYYNNLDIIKTSKSVFLKDNYNYLIQDILNNKISKIFINIDYKELVSINNEPFKNNIIDNYHITEINSQLLPKIIDTATDKNIPLYFDNFKPNYILIIENLINNILSLSNYIVPFFLFVYFAQYIFLTLNQNSFINNNMNQLMTGTKNNKFTLIKSNISLNDWAGSPEVIEECYEIINYLENKELYKELGAEMPKGILLEGPPGTGKTLLAKAIASETNSTFISVSGSEFIEMFVGVGASRVRELFKSARENSPTIIFIDEIDSIGKQRGFSTNGGNDEKDQTLNQILYEMDGFNSNENIVVMGATNRKDILDKALLRPGRFDKIITIPLPDKDSRSKILELYLNNKKKDESFNIDSISQLTDGFSGAELKKLINDATILSIRNNYTTLQEKYIFDSFEKMVVGLIKKNSTIDIKGKRRVSIHEAGHALLVLKFSKYFDFQKVSIQPTYNGAGGYTLFTENSSIKDSKLYTKDFLKKRLIITMGGKAAENIIYGDNFVSLGSTEDLKQANKLAQKMIGNFGMGNNLEVFFNENLDDNSITNKYSEYTKEMIDKESLNLVKEAYDEAKILLLGSSKSLFSLSELLINNTVLYKKDIDNNFLI